MQNKHSVPKSKVSYAGAFPRFSYSTGSPYRTAVPERKAIAMPNFSWRSKLLFGSILLLVLGSFGLYSAVQHSSSAVAEFRSGMAGYCLDDHQNSAAVNAAVDDWSCNGTAAQSFSQVGTTITHDNRCLGIDQTSLAHSNLVSLQNCNGTANQAWDVGIFGLMNVSSGQCLAVPAAGVGRQLVVSSCDNLLKPSEVWVASIWHKTDIDSSPAIACASLPTNQAVACNAAVQWNIWQSGTVSHSSLLNKYTDGNAYEEWCADFVSYIYKQSGKPFSNGERDNWDEYAADTVQNMGFTYHSAKNYTPKAGDVAYFNYPGGHVEIVAIGGSNPLFIYGNSGVYDKQTSNGEMAEDHILQNAFGLQGHVTYYLSPNS
jgi:hypothetical protein